jgi:8-oxo-dGTP diphosphatase
VPSPTGERPGADPAAARRRILVVAALIEQGGRILLSRRRPDQSLPNCWEFPGGKVEPGESPEAALLREIEEELGCTVAVGAIFEVVFHAYPHFDLYMLVYRCQITAGAPGARQVAAIDWFDPREIPSLQLPPADYPLAERLAREAVKQGEPLPGPSPRPRGEDR